MCNARNLDAKDLNGKSGTILLKLQILRVSNDFTYRPLLYHSKASP